jgi:hypothetical protein
MLLHYNQLLSNFYIYYTLCPKKIVPFFFYFFFSRCPVCVEKKNSIKRWHMPTLNGVLVMSGRSTSNCRRKLRSTVITDVVFAYSTAQNAFCCLVGAISKILCPRERRVFQSKLGVSSSNQCSLHHSPHTGHLEKKRVQSFSDTCIYPTKSYMQT